MHEEAAFIGPIVISIVFWLFVGAVSIFGIIYDYRKRRDALDVVKLAIERGQQLDQDLINKLTGRNPARNINGLMIGGIITMTAGIGIVIMSFFLARIDAEAFFPVCGGGIIAICVGIGLLAASYFIRHSKQLNP
jgi:hypothetical protein